MTRGKKGKNRVAQNSGLGKTAEIIEIRNQRKEIAIEGNSQKLRG
jgi:hypothetical protein